jgi:hypothetical protein
MGGGLNLLHLLTPIAEASLLLLLKEWQEQLQHLKTFGVVQKLTLVKV